MQFLKKQRLLLVGLFFIVTPAAAFQDSLFFENDLFFSSNLEENAFHELIVGGDHYFAYLSCLHDGIDSATINKNKTYVDKIVGELKQSGMLNKKHVKQIKIVYNKIHESFFDKYELKNSFTNIFEKGEYNCVSASGLYAIVFDELGIPYNLKETPTHVYLVAYPSEEKIIVESTDPAVGYYSFSDAFKRAYVEKMKSLKLISVADGARLTYDELFSKYFYSDESIDLKSLVGIQYYNDGLYKLESENYLDGFRQLQKSYYLYPQERTKYSMFVAASSYLSHLSNDSKDYAEFTVSMAHFRDYGINKNDILGEFGSLTNVWLFQKGDTAYYSHIHDIFKQIEVDSTYQNDLDYNYYYEKSRYLISLGRKKEALQLIEKSYMINPGNVQGQAFFIALIAQNIGNLSQGKRRINLLENYASKYKSLLKNRNFSNMIMDAYLQNATDSYYDGQASEGQVYLSKYEDLIKQLPDSEFSELAIGNAYSAAAMYYYRLGSKFKARKQIERGLGINPGNSILKQKLKYFR